MGETFSKKEKEKKKAKAKKKTKAKDADKDGIINEGTDQEKYVGVQSESNPPEGIDAEL